MSCGVALAVSLLLSDPNIAMAAALPPPAADAPVSVAGEPLFSDIIMPGTMNGRSLAREAQRVYPKLRVLLTSGYAGEASSAQDRTDPEIRILRKPYRLRDLAEAIHTALNGQSDENI